ncbi:MAG: hypothetical protein A3F72_07490 [Bacteroidetes bacterium RIFCSPLOWO2_12_FULL_35_15]|nr:MAG: hypothetical protein A3F72_07490 [Bacteroidetes bacterium RIFCSPLOWO2_12_FULL_35_15]
MKKLLLLTSLALLAVSNLSVAQIPNSGFETWTSMGSYSNPSGWGTMNNTTTSSSVYTATKGTPGSPGTGYLNLTSQTVGSVVVNGIAVSGKLDSITKLPISGFAFNLRPQKFTGKWQHMIYGSSQGSISVKLTRWNTSTNSRETVANANQTLSGMAMSWATFTINFVYQTGNSPDTCIIVLKASGSNPTADDYLWVDNLSFTGSVSGTGIESHNFLNSLVIYPNPSSSTILVDLNLKSSEKTTFELTDLIGKIILSKTVSLPQGESSQIFDISGFAKGSYFIKINTESGSETRKIVVE